MAGEIPDLVAEVRAGTGKGAARQTRREGKVPAVVYGGGQDPLPIALDFNTLLTRLKRGRFLATLYNLKVEGHEDVRIIARDVQRDVVKDLPTHVDFLRLRRTTKIALYIPVEVVDRDKAPGIKRGGVLTMIRPEVELVCTAGDIPEKITVSVEGLGVGDSIHISDATLPEGVRPVIDRDFVIANIQPPSGLASQSDDEEGTPPADEVPTTEMGPPDGEEAES